MTLELEAAATTATGVREANEDRVHAQVPDDPAVRQRKGALLVVADGLGGHRAGEVASELAVRTVVEDYYRSASNDRVEPALRHAVQSANLRVHESALRDAALRTMETTLVAVALVGASAYVAHVGDSRVYRWRAGRLSQLTNDHSEVAELVRLRVLSRERVRDHPRRSVLTRTIGGQLIVRPDFVRATIAADDRFLLCSDGLWAALDDAELARLVAPDLPAAEACAALVRAALDAGSDDNVSAVVARVRSAPPPDLAPAATGWRWLPIRRAGRAP